MQLSTTSYRISSVPRQGFLLEAPPPIDWDAGRPAYASEAPQLEIPGHLALRQKRLVLEVRGLPT